MQKRIHRFVIGHQKRFGQANARSPPQEFVTHLCVSALDRQHQRRPVIILEIVPVQVRAGVEQQAKNLPVLVLNGEMQRLRPPAHKGMGTISIHQTRVLGNLPPNVFNETSGNEPEKQRWVS